MWQPQRCTREPQASGRRPPWLQTSSHILLTLKLFCGTLSALEVLWISTGRSTSPNSGRGRSQPMSDAIKEVVNIDRVVHEPARLAILLTLEACEFADFKFLQAATGLTTSNLSLHLTKLETHGLIAIEKTFVRKTPRTIARLTKEGKAGPRAHRRLLEGARGCARELTWVRE